MPWPEYHGNAQQDFAVTLSFPIIDHERLMVATFTNNANKRHYDIPGPDFRLVCSKKRPDVAVVFKDGTRTRAMSLREAMRRFGTHPAYCYPEISEQDEKTLAKWLGEKGKSENHFMPELNVWTENAVEETTLARADARGELRDEDVYLCPEELPDGLVEYIRRVPLSEDNILLYDRGNVRGTCFQCGARVRATRERFRQFEYSYCPNCGAKVMAILNGGSSFKADYVDDIITIQRGTDGATVFLRQWHIVRDNTAKWENIPAQLDEIARYAVRGNKAAKWQREAKEYGWYQRERYRLNDWTRYKKVTEIYDGQYYFFLPDNWKDVLSGTSLQYCDMSGCMEQKVVKNHVRFMLDWARYPAIEKFWKAGYKGLVNSKIHGYRPNGEKKDIVRWNRDSIREALRFPFRLLKLYSPEEWTSDQIARTAAVWELAAAGRIRESEIETLVRSTVGLKNISNAFGHASVYKIIRYIEKGSKERSFDRVSWTYRDYLDDCVKLRLNLDDPAVLFPANLDAAHERTIAQVKHNASKMERAAFKKAVKKLESLVYEQNGLILRPPKNAKELIDEGKHLHHCVGGYVNRVATGETAIFFIRREAEPDIPFFTLEWKNGRIIQCRTTHNRSYESDDQVRAFVDAWVKKVAKKSKTVAVA